MIVIGAFEAKNTLGSLLDRVENGDEVLITRFGKPVARLVSSSGGVDRSQVAVAAERIRLRRGEVSGGVSWDELRQDRDLGRL